MTTFDSTTPAATGSSAGTAEDTVATAKRIVCEILEIDPTEMTLTSNFVDDHDADSMGAIEVLSALERAFDIEIDQSELTRMVDLAGVLAVVDDALAQRQGS